MPDEERDGKTICEGSERIYASVGSDGSDGLRPLRLDQRLDRLEAVGTSMLYCSEHRAAAREEVVACIIHHRKIEARQKVLEFLEGVSASVHFHGIAVMINGVVERLGTGRKMRGVPHDGIHEDRLRRTDGVGNGLFLEGPGVDVQNVPVRSARLKI